MVKTKQFVIGSKTRKLWREEKEKRAKNIEKYWMTTEVKQKNVNTLI